MPSKSLLSLPIPWMDLEEHSQVPAHRTLQEAALWSFARPVDHSRPVDRRCRYVLRFHLGRQPLDRNIGSSSLVLLLESLIGGISVSIQLFTLHQQDTRRECGILHCPILLPTLSSNPPTKLTLPPQPFSISDESERNHRHRQGNKSQQRVRPVDP